MRDKRAREVRRLVVVSHVIHYLHEGVLSAYGPYAREIDIWADLFPEVVIASPCRMETPPPDALAFTRANIRIAPQHETGGDRLRAKLRQLLLLPAHAWRLSKALRAADAVHVRCPGNLGLMGAALAPLFSSRLVAKYAGQWNGYEGEPLTVRAQRAILRSRWWRGPVTVYGAWPDQPAHIVPFFTSMMTAEQVERAVSVAARKRIESPLRILFSGRLVAAKRVAALLEGLSITAREGLRIEATIVGDGPERESLERRARELGIAAQVRFTGALGFDEALKWYEWAHCLLLPSRHSEGWPKVVAEAMCHGLICVAVAHGQLPSMLEGRGLLLSEGTGEEIADVLADIARRPARYEELMRAASLWSRRYSLEGLRASLAELLSERWNASLEKCDARERAKKDATGRVVSTSAL